MRRYKKLTTKKNLVLWKLFFRGGNKKYCERFIAVVSHMKFYRILVYDNQNFFCCLESNIHFWFSKTN